MLDYLRNTHSFLKFLPEVSDYLIICATLTILCNDAIPPCFIREIRVHGRFLGQRFWSQNLFKTQLSASFVKCFLVFIKYLLITKGYAKENNYRRNLLLVQELVTNVTEIFKLAWGSPEGKWSFSKDSQARLLSKCSASTCTFVIKWTWKLACTQGLPLPGSCSLFTIGVIISLRSFTNFLCGLWNVTNAEQFEIWL